MTSIQTTIDFLVELGKFRNVDLFQRGYYQVRLAFKMSPKVPCHMSRPEIFRSTSAPPECCDDTIQLAYVDAESRAASKTVQILYKDQMVSIDDSFLFKVHVSLDPSRFENVLRKTGLLLSVQLWFTEEASSSDVLEKLVLVCDRQLRIHFLPTRGLHQHLPIFFDYFHLCAIGLTLHGALTNISHCHLPNLRAPRNTWTNGDASKTQYSSWESILFTSTRGQSVRLAGAAQLHRRLCHLLLSAYESLQGTLLELIDRLPGVEQIRIDKALRSSLKRCAKSESQLLRVSPAPHRPRRASTQPSLLCQVDCHHRLESICSTLSSLTDEEEIAQVVCTTIGELSSENLMLFHQMVDIVASQPAIAEHLGRRNHHLRVKRFAETFFVHETSASQLLSIYETNVTGHEGLAQLVRTSRYFNGLPPMPIESPELDGDPTTMPIIFEDVYLPEVSDRRDSVSASQVLLRESRNRSNSIANGSAPRARTLIPHDLPLPRARPLASISADLPDSCEGKRQAVSLVGYRKLTEPDPGQSSTSSESTIALGTLSPQARPGSRSGSCTSYRKVTQSMPDLSGALSTSSRDRRKQKSLGRATSLAALGISLDFAEESVLEEQQGSDSDNGSLADDSEGSAQLTVLEMLRMEENDERKTGTGRRHSANSGEGNTSISHRSSSRLVQIFSSETVEFVTLKEELKQKLSPYPGNLYSDFPTLASTRPYFSEPGCEILDKGIHMVICVHGLDGNSADLRLVRTYLQLSLPDERLVFVMSERNQADTFVDFEQLTDNLVTEIMYHLTMQGGEVDKISFVAHSMGCLLVRAAVNHSALERFRPRLHTFLSLSGPHLGTLYSSSGLVNMAMWVMQRWKKSGSLLQLALKDSPNIRDSFVYKLSEQSGLELFRFVLLVSSLQDRYVPYHSTRIELCKAAVKDNSEIGAVYMEMVTNILQRILKSARTTVIRYDVFHSLGSNANTLIGRAAHIAVLDSEIFLEKFLTVCAAKYFR